MTREEFGPILAWVKTACGVKEITREQMEVYLESLGHYPAKVVEIAARQAVMDHEYPTLPPLGAIAKRAAALVVPAVSAAEAWELACKAVRRFGTDPELPGYEANVARGMATLPERVARTVRSFGWRALQDMSSKFASVERERFTRLYGEMVGEQQELTLLPPAVAGVTQQLAEASRPKELGSGLSQRTEK